jgi:predicted O-linked N-acetylglucosamine transferase (SPINDLY family)
MLPPPSRTAPCPCGSGKRFKDCHGALDAGTGEPSTPDELLRRAQVAVAGGQWSAAHPLLDEALKLAPDRADLLRERARVEWTLGDANAAATCRAALARSPGDIAGWNLLGEILNATDAAAAETAWREALQLDPQDPEALFHLGNRNRERGENDAAISHYERALARAPGHPGVLNNLGLALEATGQSERAESCYREVLAAQRQHADALANLANLLQAQERYHEAMFVYEKAIAVRRDFPANFWHARGVTLGELGAYADAEQSFREAARLAPDQLLTQLDLGSMCIVQEKFDEAEAPLARVLELDPSNAYATTMLTLSRMQRCVWDGLDDAFARLRALVMDQRRRARDNAVPLPLLAMPLGADVEFVAAQRWARQLAASMGSKRLPDAIAAAPGVRARVGFLSSDLRNHPVGHLLVECLERIDRARIEVFAYSLLPREVSAFGQRIAQASEHFVDCSFQAAEHVARRIRGDDVQLLIDLNGYTTHARSEIFALRPAPVQLSWLGYLGTLGAPWYDYVITDRFVSPPATQAFFTERFLYLPDCYCPSDTKRAIAPVAPTRAACGLPEQSFVFCCFNNSYKILPAVFEVWMRLLSAVPASVLWLAPTIATAGVNLRREAAARGVDPARLIFAPRVALPEHLARHAHADLFLDTAPYNAGATANDALFMGVPVITCAGATMASRVAGSQLTAIGLPELVTYRLADYEAQALALARDPAQLLQLRARLAANRRTHPLFDMARFTRALDDLLLAAWENRSAPARS